ncbi:MAG: class I SAM-dependent methyltransferase [Solirubrobacterales bacterium]
MSSEVITGACWLCGGDAVEDPQYAGTILSRCTKCGFLFDAGHTAEELQKLYGDDYFEAYTREGDYAEAEEQRRTEARKRIEWLKRFHEAGRIFEVGAASGFFLDEARKAGYEVSGVEPAPGVAEYARERFGLDVTTGFLEDAELPEASFDAICAFHVLEHIHNPLDVLKDIRRSLTDEGHLLLEIPNIESIMARKRGADWMHLRLPHHVGFYSPAQLEGMLKKAGFELLETDSVSEYFYYRELLKFRPQTIAARSVKRVATKTPQSKPHPINHPYLRATARAA